VSEHFEMFRFRQKRINMREIFSRVMDSIKKNITGNDFCVTYERVDAKWNHKQ